MSALPALWLAVVSVALTPLGLDGESAGEAGGNGAATAALSAVSIVLGYLVLFLLWRYVFSPRARARRGEPPDRDR